MIDNPHIGKGILALLRKPQHSFPFLYIAGVDGFPSAPACFLLYALGPTHCPSPLKTPIILLTRTPLPSMIVSEVPRIQTSAQTPIQILQPPKEVFHAPCIIPRAAGVSRRQSDLLPRGQKPCRPTGRSRIHTAHRNRGLGAEPRQQLLCGTQRFRTDCLYHSRGRRP